MTDSMNDFEAELASLRPSPLPKRVVDAIAHELAESAPPSPRMRLADRCLLAAMGAGSLAACVIVALLTWQVTGGTQRPISPTQVIAVQSSPPSVPATLGQYQQALARAGSSDGVAEILR